MEPLTPDKLEATLAEAVRRLRAEFGHCRVYLFGSYAEGRAGRDSDLDLMVVVPGEPSEEFDLNVRAFEALSGLGAPVDVVVRTTSKFERRSLWLSSLERDVLERGRLLHAA